MKRPDATPFVSRLADRAVSVVCPPKLNLTLAVGKPRADGLHPIASLMIGLGPGFADTLALERLEAGPSTFDIRFDPDAPIPGDVDWPSQSDLSVRAHLLMEKEARRTLPVRCVLTKRIPVGAGLGGGSSDAAGMLVGLRELFDLQISDERLVSMGSLLGSDIGFCVHAALGCRVAWVTGVGEQIEPYTFAPSLHGVLLLSHAKCPTAEVYGCFDRISAGRSQEQMPQKPALDAASFGQIVAYNDLAQAAMETSPSMRDLAQLAKSLGIEPQVSGSGSALFVICPEADSSQHIRNRIQQHGIVAVQVSV